VADIPELEAEIVVAVGTPRRSRNKYEYDADLAAIVLDRRL
jgi:inorganic pyrophosphatase